MGQIAGWQRAAFRFISKERLATLRDKFGRLGARDATDFCF
jgi:hypothetical protein